MSRDVLEDTDYPGWLQEDNVEINTIDSRCKLLYAHHKMFKIKVCPRYQYNYTNTIKK